MGGRRAAQQRLDGGTAGERALAAQAVLFEEGEPRAEGVGDAGGREARRARADHDHVIAAGGRLAELRARLLRCGDLAILVLPRRCHGPVSFTATSATSATRATSRRPVPGSPHCECTPVLPAPPATG